MSTLLGINGSTVGRSGARLVLGSLELSLEDPDRLTWTEICVPAGSGSWSHGDLITATVDGVLRFRGQTVAASTTPIGAGRIDVTYTALGLRFLLNQIFYQAPDGTGGQAWNLPSTDPDYGQGSAGKTIGQILKSALDQHQTQLTAVGMANPPYVQAELDALSVIPRDAVVLAGRLLDTCYDLICQWMPKYTCYPDASDGLIHFRNTLTLPTIGLTLDSDPITLDSISKSHGECYTRCVVRGGPDVQGAYLSLAEGTLAAGWTAPQQAAWTISDYWQPKGGASWGNITGMSSTTLIVTPSDPAEAWPTTHKWSDLGGVVWAFDPAATGITFQEQRYIVSNTVKAAGASGTLTVDQPWNNSGYSRYQVRGNFSDVSMVWRKMVIRPIDGAGHNYVADHLVRNFPHSMPWSPSGGVVVNVTNPVGVVCWSSSHSPPLMEFPWPFILVLPDGATSGYILFNEPLVKAYSTQSQLTAGGGSVLAPDDVKVLVPYSLGALTATIPADVSGVAQYEGTAFATDTIRRTMYVDYGDWIDRRDVANMLLLAREHLDSRKDTVYEGQCTYEGKLTTALTLGKALNVGRVGGTTGLETLAAPIRSVSLEYQDNAAIWLTRIRFSSRRRAFTGDRLFAPVAWGSSAQIGEGHTLGLTGAAMGLVGVNRGADPLGVAGIALPAAQDTGGYSPEGPGSRGGKQAGNLAADAAGANTYGRQDTYEDREQQAQRDAISGREQSKKELDETIRGGSAAERRFRKESIAATGKPDRGAVTQADQVARDRAEEAERAAGPARREAEEQAERDAAGLGE